LSANAGYELAYEEAKRTLENQAETVNEFRSRAGVLLAAAAVVTSFFGGQVLIHDADGVTTVPAAAWLGIACFAGLGIATLAMLWPRRDWSFNANAQELIATYLEPPDDQPLALAEIHRDLALHMSATADRDRAQLISLFRTFRFGGALLVAEVAAWVVALVERT
jgi:hypothetical protein